MQGEYQYLYLVENGVVAFDLNDGNGPVFVDDAPGLANDERLSSDFSTYSGFQYAGFSDENGVYFYVPDDDHYFYATNTPYAEGAPGPDFDNRETGAYVACFLTGTAIATPEGARD